MSNRYKDTQARRLTQQTQRLIFNELRRLGIKYSGMNIREAAGLVAKGNGFSFEAKGKTKKWAYRFIAAIKMAQSTHTSPTALSTLSPPYAILAEFYNSPEWLRLSYDIKKIRGRQCECCGARAPQVRIITDHIKPIRHHWHLRLDPTNLQILCDDCNLGKGSRDETDFRPDANVVAFPDAKTRER